MNFYTNKKTFPALASWKGKDKEILCTKVV
nr:MAG TPA: hypothetical protein [Caudoviricetes sp.]